MCKAKTDQLATAINVAASFHEKQRDKLGKPYIHHPIAVMLKMDEDDIDGQIVAVLHDIVEDTVMAIYDLPAFGFDEEIVEAIDAITHREGETNLEYWTRLKCNPIALRVKLKDIEHNTSPERMEYLDPETRERLTKKYTKALEVLQGK